MNESSTKVLFLAASPGDLARLALGREREAIENGLRQIGAYEVFDFRPYWDVEAKNLQQLLMKNDPEIVHFSGHGTERNEIVLLSETGKAVPLPNATLKRLFQVRKASVRCIVLNACFSEAQAKELSKYVDCVIGVSEEIGDQAAIGFATAFYQSLGKGESVQQAYDSGCLEIELGEGDPKRPQLLAPDSNPSAITFRRVDIPVRTFTPVPTPPRMGSNLPNPHPDFVGRSAEIDKVMKALSSRYWIVTINGIGGIGKTTLALQVAHLCRSRPANYPDLPDFLGLIWTSARGNPSFCLDDIERSIFGVLASEDVDKSVEDLHDRVMGLFSQDRPHLLIIDNFETIEDEQVFEFIKNIPSPSKVIITSRHHHMLPGELWVTIGGLAKPDAIRLLRNEAARLNLTLNAENAAYLDYISEKTYGIPALLRWVMESIRSGKTMDWILGTLDKATANEIYEYIFEYSLSLLDNGALAVFDSMSILPEWADLSIISAMHPDMPAIEERISKLVSFSLLEDNGSFTARSRRYRQSNLARNLATKRRKLQTDAGKP